MNDRQQKLLKKIRPNMHIAQAMDIDATQLNKKKQALESGKKPTFGLRRGEPQLFEPAYKATQIEFYNDLIAIAAEKLKELEIENGN